MCESESHSVVSDSLRPHGLQSQWYSLGQNTGVGSLSLLQGIFPTQGSKPSLPHCRQILYQLSHKGSSRTPEGVAYCFSRGSSWPRNWTGVSCIAGNSLPTELSGKPKYMYVKRKSLSHVWLFVTPWTVALQASLSMEFSRKEDWSGLPFPSPRYMYMYN